MNIEILKTTKIYNNRIYLPNEIRKKLEAENGDIIIFALNDREELIIFKNKKEEKKPNRFTISTTT